MLSRNREPFPTQAVTGVVAPISVCLGPRVWEGLTEDGVEDAEGEYRDNVAARKQ